MTSVTYSSYLRLDELLMLQQRQSEEHDEMLFIVIHQVYELWFKQILHELDYVQQAFRGGDTARVLQTLRRILVILKTMIAQIDVLETMTPLEFETFRGRLESASGFQSGQFRELEFALGLKRGPVLHGFPEGTEMRRRLESRYQQPALWDSFLQFLAGSGYSVPSHVLSRDFTEPYVPTPEVQTSLIDVYRHDLNVTQVCERLIDLDEGLQEWRYRHVKMVERTIGTKHGTGGSSGVKYLRTTLFRPFFPDLWEIRSEL